MLRVTSKLARRGFTLDLLRDGTARTPTLAFELLITRASACRRGFLAWKARNGATDPPPAVNSATGVPDTNTGNPGGVAMASIRAFLIPAAAILAPVHAAVADPSTVLPDGAYEIVSRLELPHVERWAVDKTTRSCLSNASNAGDLPIPVVSANNPFANCAAANLAVSGASVEYDIVCPGRASAKAHASYMTTQDGFSGRVAMVMAAKNMTMTEVVRAHRLGECDANGHQASDDPRPLATGR